MSLQVFHAAAQEHEPSASDLPAVLSEGLTLEDVADGLPFPQSSPERAYAEVSSPNKCPQGLCQRTTSIMCAGKFAAFLHVVVVKWQT